MALNSKTSLALRTYRAARYLKLTRNPAALRVLSQFPKLELSVFEAGGEGAGVRIKGTDIDVTAKRFQFLLRGSECVRRLVEEAQASFSALPDGALVEVGGVKLKLESWEELFTAMEVFAGGIYNVKIRDNFVLVDIGMNVATTSLFFARLPACRVVYAFEPFPKTIAKARTNLSLNPELAQKIRATAKGVAARDFSAELDYVEEYKGSIGLHGLPEYASPQGAPVHSEKVRAEFSGCVEVFSDILARHRDNVLVCKVDCEGAEYEILATLAQAGLLGRIGYFMIEWHQKGAAPLERLLSENGFSLLSLSPNAATHSMIYAWQEGTGQGRPAGTAR